MRTTTRIGMIMIAAAVAVPITAWAAPTPDPECVGKAEGDLCRAESICAEAVYCDRNLRCGSAHPQNNNEPCEPDTDACTVDRCDGGNCKHNKPVDCDDENDCTLDSCDPDALEGEQCQHAAVVCDDGNACTTDTCTPGTGCVFGWNTNDCAQDQCGTSACGNDCGGCVVQCLPDITCPADVIVECIESVGQNTLGAATASCDAEISNDGAVSYAFTCEGENSHDVTYTATNEAGSDSCVASLTVEDTAKPSATCGAGSTVKTSEQGGVCSASLTPSASGTDACEGPLTGTCDPDELTLNAPGTTSATCTVADCSGNSASCTQSLTLIDDTPPTITCASPLVTPPAAPMSWTAFTVTDNCGGTASAQVTGVDCYFINGAGKVVSKLAACKASYSTNTVSVGPSAGGVGTIIKWMVSAQDGSGNSSIATCTTQVQNPGLTR